MPQNQENEMNHLRTPNAAAGLLLFRVGRDLERVGDLMKNIAEDLVYLETGEIVRHQKRK